jgi:hypothetical protein
MTRFILYNALLFGACGYAWYRGRTDARIAAAVIFIGSFVTYALRSRWAASYSSLEGGIFAVDVLALVGFVYVAMSSDRFWPLWVSGLQLTTTMGHVMKAIQSDLLPLAYAAALRFWGYPILIIIAVGTWRSHRRAAAEREGTTT